ncbi:hypothetical protein BVC80_1505g12 [Macleaya cordata]|uniref:Uncharacterized protein n=1 Tax=Macleaya cordata TaxID=56857 RepID=A0A200PM26_MACCD|nr:hypothetical protein BVC80_1505g12 [Macleaya cordata]
MNSEVSRRLINALVKGSEVQLALLHVAKVTGGAPNKLSKIKVAKLSIAQESLKTEREKKKEMYFPMRKFAIKFPKVSSKDDFVQVVLVDQRM